MRKFPSIKLIPKTLNLREDKLEPNNVSMTGEIILTIRELIVLYETKPREYPSLHQLFQNELKLLSHLSCFYDVYL